MTRPQRAALAVGTLLTRAALVIACGLILCLPRLALAFPELTRHGYASCTTCHVSPNGGGALSPYGRSLAREILSTWGGEREGEVAHGLLPKAWGEALEKSSLRLGGDARWIQTHRENSQIRAGQFFFMQLNAEIAWDQGPWAAALAIGKIEDPRGQGAFQWYSQRYYGMYRFIESESGTGAIRAGRFSTAFGLNLADHTLSVRRTLGLGPEIERDNIEASWIGERNLWFVSGMKTAPSASNSDRETAMILRYERIVRERSRIGASLWRGDGGDTSATGTAFERWIFGAHSIVNISGSVFFLGEIIRQEKLNKRAASSDLVQSQFFLGRLYYEPLQGIVPLLQIQHERGDVGLDSSETNKYGLGISLFPRPHFEIFGIWNRVKRPAEWSDEAYLLLHYYL